jgi:hypothetical protein
MKALLKEVGRFGLPQMPENDALITTFLYLELTSRLIYDYFATSRLAVFRGKLYCSLNSLQLEQNASNQTLIFWSPSALRPRRVFDLNRSFKLLRIASDRAAVEPSHSLHNTRLLPHVTLNIDFSWLGVLFCYLAISSYGALLLARYFLVSLT